MPSPYPVSTKEKCIYFPSLPASHTEHTHFVSSFHLYKHILGDLNLPKVLLGAVTSPWYPIYRMGVPPTETKSVISKFDSVLWFRQNMIANVQVLVI